MAKKLEKT